MRLPRWLVITMLSSSALTILGFAGWWWVTWPERMAREYVTMRATKSNERGMQVRVRRLTNAEQEEERVGYFFPRRWTDVTPQCRTFIDVLIGRRCDFHCGADDSEWPSRRCDPD